MLPLIRMIFAGRYELSMSPEIAPFSATPWIVPTQMVMTTALTF
jgi:hypothetical protein